jgi:hypothetical protein
MVGMLIDAEYCCWYCSSFLLKLCVYPVVTQAIDFQRVNGRLNQSDRVSERRCFENHFDTGCSRIRQSDG